MSAKTSETRRKLEWRSASRDHCAPSASTPAAVTVLAALAAIAEVAAAPCLGEPFSVEFARLFGVKLLQWKKPKCGRKKPSLQTKKDRGRARETL